MSLQKTIKVATIIDVLLVVSVLMIDKNLENGMYTKPVLGAVYEMLWLPLIVILFLLPISWVFLVIKKKISWIKAILPLVLLVSIIYYMLFVY